MSYVDALTQSRAFISILKRPGNLLCADCENQAPRWASTSFGVLICINCSGFHRRFGSHITKVRSLDLDNWTAELLSIYKSLGTLLKIHRQYKS